MKGATHRRTVIGALLALATLLALAGCTLPGEPVSTPTVHAAPPTWTPDLAAHAVRPIASADYRRATEARGDRVNAALERLHAACRGGAPASCQPALAEAQEAIDEPGLLLHGTPPPGCRTLFTLYNGLVIESFEYRQAINWALGGGDVAATDAGRYAQWSEMWGRTAQILQTDPCL